MIAAMNGIKVIDGYHTLYPKSYKKNFERLYRMSLKKVICTKIIMISGK